MDATTWEQAGLYDPTADKAADRLALLEYLAQQGCDLEEMLEADARDRLFALAGDRLIRPMRPRYDCETAAAALGTDAEWVSRAWRGFGLPAPVEPVLGELDLEALRTCMVVRDVLGDEGSLGLARVLGSGIARLAEAESSAMRTGLAGTIDRGRSDSEAAVAQAYVAVATLVPSIGVVLDAVHRHHLEAARRHFEEVAPTPDSTRCAIGFADISNFTRISQELPLPALSKLLAAFEETASDTVHDAGGRVVKFLGDAVMFVAPTASMLARIACELVGHVRAREAELEVRAGMAYGDVLAQDGDYFGPPVNLAARLVAAAEPGQVLASPAAAELLGSDHSVEPLEPRLLRGIDAPVTPYLVRTA